MNSPSAFHQAAPSGKRTFTTSPNVAWEAVLSTPSSRTRRIAASAAAELFAELPP